MSQNSAKQKIDLTQLVTQVKDEVAKNQPTQKNLPQNIEAEQAILGSFLHNNENANKVADFLLPEHFFIPIHKKIYEAILRFMDRSMIATPITLKHYLETDKAFQNTEMNCLDYLIKLTENAELLISIPSLAHTIQDLYLRRQLIQTGQDIALSAYEYNAETSGQEKLEAAEQQLFQLATQGNNQNFFHPLSSSLTKAITQTDELLTGKRKTSGTTTNFKDLDQKTGGLQNSDLIIIAARPSMGKTSLAITLALNIASHFKKEHNEKQTQAQKHKAQIPHTTKPQSVAIFSLEMSAQQIANRILSIESGLNSNNIRMGKMAQTDFAKLSKASASMSSLPIFIDDSPSITISALRTRARRIKRQHNLGLLIVDYLQLLHPSSKNANINRVQEIGEISQGLKAIAKEIDIPVIALSQLSRAVETREDKRPLLSDLRESGNIEQDADVVMFLYREEYYLTRKTQGLEKDSPKWQDKFNEVANKAELIIAKQRNGPIGTCLLHFDHNTTKFHTLHSNV